MPAVCARGKGPQRGQTSVLFHREGAAEQSAALLSVSVVQKGRMQICQPQMKQKRMEKAGLWVE